MKKLLVHLLLLLQVSFSFAQYTEKMVSGRPGQAIASQTPGKHVFQLETGIEHTGADWVGSSASNWNQRAVLSATLLRFGILNKIEIHSGWEFRQDNWNQDEGDPTSAEGMSFSSIGIRHNIFEGDANKPSLGYQVSAKLNILSKDYNPDAAAPQFMITSGMSLNDRLGLTLNSGMDFGTKTTHSWIYIVNFGFSISDKLFTFAEIYGSQTISKISDAPDPFAPKFDAGFGYFLNNNMQLDAQGGYALNNDFQEYFISIGFSWRLNHPKEMPAE